MHKINLHPPVKPPQKYLPMLANFDLRHLLTFPFADKEARMNFLILLLVNFLNMVVPLLPYLFIYGYLVRLMRGVINGEKPHMPAWDSSKIGTPSTPRHTPPLSPRPVRTSYLPNQRAPMN